MENVKITTNYCYYCKSYEYDVDEDGCEWSYCNRRRKHFKTGSDKIECSTFRAIQEKCDYCHKEKKITEFYNLGYPTICSEECNIKFLEQLEIENKMAEWQKENLI